MTISSLGRGLAALAMIIAIMAAIVCLVMYVEIGGFLAAITSGKRNFGLLRKLHQACVPDLSYFVGDDFSYHCHRDELFTISNCPIMRAENYEKISELCKQAGISPWKIDLAGGKILIGLLPG